jgi:hypothetical protein
MSDWGLCANVRELPKSSDFEVSVVDNFSDDVVSRNFSSKEVAVKVAEHLAEIRNLPVSVGTEKCPTTWSRRALLFYDKA